MPNPYSYDLREKALNAVDRGHRKTDVCRMFEISRNTLYLWLKLREETGDFAPVLDYHRGPKPKIDDLKAFEEFAQNNGHLTHQEMALKWHDPISKTRISQTLKRIGFSRKKKPIVMEKEMNRPERNLLN
jgi:transposase